MDAQLKRGFIEMCALAAVSRRDSYGYQIIEDMKECMEVSESTLYPVLRRLESTGMLESYSVEYGGRLRRYYRITPSGRSRLAEFEDDWAEMLRIYRFISGGHADEQKEIHQTNQKGTQRAAESRDRGYD